MMVIASKGHFFTQIPQPIHNSSEMEAIFTIGVTSIHSFPIRTTGQDFLHSCRHLLGLHLSLLTIAILVWVSVSSAAFLFNFGGILKQKSCGNCQFCRCSTRVLFRETAYSWLFNENRVISINFFVHNFVIRPSLFFWNYIVLSNQSKNLSFLNFFLSEIEFYL